MDNVNVLVAMEVLKYALFGIVVFAVYIGGCFFYDWMKGEYQWTLRHSKSS